MDVEHPFHPILMPNTLYVKKTNFTSKGSKRVSGGPKSKKKYEIQNYVR